MYKVILKPKTLLVSPVPDFFKKPGTSFISQATKSYDVAKVIMGESEKIEKNTIVYYLSNLGEEIEIIGQGTFRVIPIESVIVYLKEE